MHYPPLVPRYPPSDARVAIRIRALLFFCLFTLYSYLIVIIIVDTRFAGDTSGPSYGVALETPTCTPTSSADTVGGLCTTTCQTGPILR